MRHDAANAAARTNQPPQPAWPIPAEVGAVDANEARLKSSDPRAVDIGAHSEMLGCSCDVRGSATSPGRLDLMLPASDGEARNIGCLPVAVMVGEDAR